MALETLKYLDENSKKIDKNSKIVYKAGDSKQRRARLHQLLSDIYLAIGFDMDDLAAARKYSDKAYNYYK